MGFSRNLHFEFTVSLPSTLSSALDPRRTNSLIKANTWPTRPDHHSHLGTGIPKNSAPELFGVPEAKEGNFEM